MWDEPLAPGYDLREPITFETVEFTLTVLMEGQIRELFSGLSLVPAHERYVEQAITAETSALIQVRDLHSSSPFPARLPDPAADNLTQGVLRLQAGRNGIADLQLSDFTGEPIAEERRGLRTLEIVDDVSMVAVPDIVMQPVAPVQTAPLPPPEPDPCLPTEKTISVAEPPTPRMIEQIPMFSLDQIFTVQQALIAHCETQGDRIALLDPPLFARQEAVIDIAEIQSWRQRFDSTYAALYYPWVGVIDPLRLSRQEVRAMPPSGHVAGIFARTDTEIGVHKAPANAELSWAQNLTAMIDAERQGILNPLGINAIRVFPGRGLRLYGARTVSRDPAWRYVNVRRLMLMIKEAIEESIQWTVFGPHTFALRQTLTLAISSFLQTLFERGALVRSSSRDSATTC